MRERIVCAVALNGDRLERSPAVLEIVGRPRQATAHGEPPTRPVRTAISEIRDYPELRELNDLPCVHTDSARAAAANCPRHRLLKLVSALLAFARIKAARVEACGEPVRLDILTVDIANVFRSGMERARPSCVVDYREINEPIYIDREMR